MFRTVHIPLVGLAAAFLAMAASAQDDVFAPARPAPTLAPDARTLASQAASRGDQTEALSRYLRILATAPDDVTALVGAGKAALAVGDTNAAAGFLARADALGPRNGEVKAGLAVTLLQNGNSRAALRLFREATDLGVAPGAIAADRGLAYDLHGEPRRAQADYRLALSLRPDDEVTRRLALSEAIAGDRVAALATLDPLLRKQDVPAWRARAFIFALTGDTADALTGAALVMPRDQVDALSPYLGRLAGLKPADKALAVHLGRFPGDGPPPAAQVAARAPRLPLDRHVLAPAADDRPTQLASALPPQPRMPAPPPPIVTPTRETPAPAPSALDQEMARARAKADARADAKAKAREKARAEAAARDKEEREAAAEERAAAKRNPARHWVQVAGGANRADLGRAWRDLKKKWPSQLAGRSPWTMHYRFTNRLLIGPFPTSEDAQDWVSERKKEGLSAFRVETNVGDVVEKVDGGD